MDKKVNENINYVKNEEEDITESIKKEILKLKDPTVHAAIIYTAVREREKMNLILKNILSRVENVERKIEGLGKGEIKEGEERIFTDFENKLIKFIKEERYVCANDVQKHFNYKGTNAASARLNRLYEQRILEKKRVGKKVYYLIPKIKIK